MEKKAEVALWKCYDGKINRRHYCVLKRVSAENEALVYSFRFYRPPPPNK